MGILSLVSHVQTYFTANSVPATAVFGERERLKTGNRYPGPIGGRVSFVLAGGEYQGSTYLGPRAGDTANTTTRAIYQLNCDVEAEIWAWDDSDPSDDAVQFRAWLTLQEWTMNAIRSYAEGVYQPGPLTRDPRGPDLQRGLAYLVSLSYLHPVHKLPATSMVSASASLTATQTNPKGPDAPTTTEIFGDLPITP